MNKWISAIAVALVAVGSATSASAVSILPGATINVDVDGEASVYDIFSHDQPGGSVAAVQIDFAAGSGNVFDFSATGTIGCCNNATAAQFTPDGASGNTSIFATGSGLSNAAGDSQIPLLGVFVNLDPFGNAAPVTLAWDKDAPTNLSPLLNQVFYIGDGRGGFNNSGGALLQFAAPSNATKLFLGTADASGFNNPSGFYSDNAGFFDVFVHLEVAQQPPRVPEPGSLALLGLGLAGLAVLRRRRP